MSFINFTEAEKLRATEVSLIDYLHSRGEKLKRVGSSYFVESLNGVSIYNNKWYDHYNKKGGVAVGFLKEFYGFSYSEAVVELLGEQNIEAFRGTNTRNYNDTPQISTPSSLPNEIKKRVPNNKSGQHKKFELPERARNNDKLYDYLCNKRFIDKDIINIFIQNGSLYQSKEKNNVIFVGFDEDGVGKFGCAKGTYISNKGTFTQTLTGSNTDYCFNLNNKSDTACVFEAPIDMLSYMTMFKEHLNEYNYLALDGVSEKPLIKFLKQNKNITTINLCFDNDVGGYEATERIRDILKASGYNDIKVQLSHNKDWNEELKELNGVVPKPSVKHPKREAYLQKVDKLLFFYADNQRATEESVALKYSDITKNYKNRTFEVNEEKIEDFIVDVTSLLKKHLKHIGKNVDEKKILNTYVANYRTYKDRGRIESKFTELNELMKEFNTFRAKTTLTEDEKIAYIKNMMHIGSMGIRVNIKLEELHVKELAELEAQYYEVSDNPNFNIAEVEEQMISFG